ncbi:L-arabinose isomerase [Demequina zhanjiangensis]|uniref:L-arabinose isomerase n=1 Tax=Demequina zhanjiangensis TaxID=3051659 RepID=A0ABT8FZ44_9MICO|nr:L-arabinose isomerase [Demequina sp. SYSU T00b26]MDN4472166.1 L-arabinose isomerase [Demequina sp. SYSU T00b26]
MTGIVPNLAEYEVWFLTGSQTLYGPEVLAQVAEQSQGVVDTLKASGDVPATLVWKPVVKSRDEILDTIKAANADPKVIGIITWMHTFSPAKMWISGLNALQKPMLHLHTQANVELPWDKIDFDFMNLNQAAHGDREFGYIESRLAIPRTTVVGHASNPEVSTRIGEWSRACAGRAAAFDMKVARFGDNMRYVAVTEGDKTEAETVFGTQINTWGINELVERVDAATDEQIDALVAEYLDLYDVVDELKPGGDKHESLRYGAAVEIGLRSFLEEGGFHAFTDSFEDLGGLKQLPGLAVQRLMAEGYGFGAEGDWKTAMLVRIAAVMGSGRPGGASLMEDYTYHLAVGEELSLGAHMLEVSPSLSSKKASLEVHPLGIGGKDDPVRLVFTADPGPAIVVAMSDVRNRFRLVAAEVDNVDLPAPMPNLPVGRAVWRSKPDFATATTCWLEAGAAHHTVMSTQTSLACWKDFARMLGVELAAITEETTIDGFTRDLALNAKVFAD